MEVIKFNGKTIGYVDKPSEYNKYLPDDTLLSFKTKGKVRRLVYPDGAYTIEPSDKVKGYNVGNICSICGMGDLVDMGGCAVCSVCQASIKCGL